MKQEYIQENAEKETAPLEKRKPVKVFRHGRCSACIFFNQVVRNGETVELPSVSFAKLYTRQGRLRATSSLHQEDLTAAILVIGQAYEWLRQLEIESGEVMDDGF